MRKLGIAAVRSISCCLVLILETNSFALVDCGDGKPSEKNYGKIVAGMSKKQVIQLIGEPKDSSKPCTEFPVIPFFPALGRASIWQSDQIRIVIIFDSDGRVYWKRLDRAR